MLLVKMFLTFKTHPPEITTTLPCNIKLPVGRLGVGGVARDERSFKPFRISEAVVLGMGRQTPVTPKDSIKANCLSDPRVVVRKPRW